MLKRQNKIWSIMAVLAVAAMSASAQTVKSKIENMTGWENCAACAGSGGSGPSASLYTASGVSSPSMDGSSRVFKISSSNAYADALWWKQLGAANGASNLVYDLYFYIKTPQYSQALEFDANQANGSHRWVFGTQCNIAAGVWDVWANAAGKWTSTGVKCSVPTAYKWHHLTWEFKRSGSYVVFIAFTYDGVKHYINKSYPAKSSSVNELNVAFQMDMKANHVSYSTWLDQISLKYW
jgi:hypothetical protein